MTKASSADYSAHLAGFGRLATAAVAGVTDVVEAVHRQIACPFGGLGAPAAERLTPGISGLVYDSIRGVNRLVELGFAASASLSPASPTKVSPRREAIVAVLNGVVGDYLVRTNNPLAISMSLRRDGLVDSKSKGIPCRPSSAERLRQGAPARTRSLSERSEMERP